MNTIVSKIKIPLDEQLDLEKLIMLVSKVFFLATSDLLFFTIGIGYYIFSFYFHYFLPNISGYCSIITLDASP